MITLQDNTKRKKRIKALKKIIIVIALVLLLSSVALNFVLLFKVMHLNKQVHDLYDVSASAFLLENEFQV